MSVIVERRFMTYGGPLIKLGLGYGAVAAMILSYSVNKSILWMIIDGWFSWLYVIFFALFKS
ncbi:MAG: hypothetical protein KGI37_10050 [Alphaproteobacteria bacterium]|nr:hypothetical protein [Alphaproteobacteria bacterium]